MFYIPNKFLYLAIPKTGSTAITNHLENVFKENIQAYKIKTGIETQYEENSFHPSIWDVPEDFLTTEVFFCTVTRNPYSRFLSHYFYCLLVLESWEKYKSTPYGKKIIESWDGSLEALNIYKNHNLSMKDYQDNLFLEKPKKEYFIIKDYFEGVNCFKDYVHKFCEFDLVETFFVRQVTFTHYAWKYENKKMDFIGKMENLQESFDFICKKNNIKTAKLKKVNTTRHGNWQNYYDYESKKIINSIYDIDFKYLDYKK